MLVSDLDSTIVGSLTLTDAAGNFRVATALQNYRQRGAFGHERHGQHGGGQPLLHGRRLRLHGCQRPAAGLGAYRHASRRRATAARQRGGGGGQQIAAADLALRFVPAADANGTGYASFSFSVSDGITSTPRRTRSRSTSRRSTTRRWRSRPLSRSRKMPPWSRRRHGHRHRRRHHAQLRAERRGAGRPELQRRRQLHLRRLGGGLPSLAGAIDRDHRAFTVTDNAGASSTANLVITVTGTTTRRWPWPMPAR
ncbi:hypothetical protein FSC37_05360 [Piscinibacter aquaticus]|uniref:Uncharacterized protein n=1 Tax=Piscinibacter aquaticus TaxID=392597 RepID=A0A5C6U1N1_9BURK|nr:hypothetical protein FSC37_05360 [Piscinibacter aquaticus]